METNFYEEEYIIAEKRPFYYFLTQKRLFKTQAKLALLGIGIAWFPLAILTLIDGTFYSNVELPFIYDIAIHPRLLLSLPILILIKVSIDNKLYTVTRHLCDTLLDTEDREHLINTYVHRAKQLTNSVLANFIMLGIVIALTSTMVIAGLYDALDSSTISWMTNKSGSSLSLAGFWCSVISIPLIQFFTLKWAWHYFVWSILLFRISRSNLKLLPTHADNSGGLGFLMQAQYSFVPFFGALAVTLSGEFTAEILRDPEAFNTIRAESLGFIAISVVLLALPMIFFFPGLTKLKNNGLIHLNGLSTTLSKKFEEEWVNDTAVEKKLDQHTIDPSLVFDYNSLYTTIKELKTVPVSVRDLIPMAIMLFIPFIPILFIHFSVAELMQRLTGMLL